MAVVEEYRIGKTVVRIRDDCCANVSEEEIRTILDRIASKALTELSSAQTKKEMAG